MVNRITDDIRYVKGVGPSRARLLGRLGINIIEDIFYYFPRRYEDRTRFNEIAGLKIGEYQMVRGKILKGGQRLSYHNKGIKIFKIMVEDNSGRLACVWFNQPYLRNYLKEGEEVVLYGRADFFSGELQFQNPEYEIAGEKAEENLNYGRIIPLYPLTENLSQRAFRKIVKFCLDKYISCLSDALPYDIRRRNSLQNIAEAIINTHFPKDIASQEASYRRIVFEEYFLIQLLFRLKRLEAERAEGIEHKVNQPLLDEFVASLPFELTGAQKRVISEITVDMASMKPMHRLLQGDVASGKTIVALYASILAVSGGYQVAFMVPTEILAEQHIQNIRSYINAYSQKNRPVNPVRELSGFSNGVNTALLTSGIKKPQKEKLYGDIKNGKVDIVVGTHALIQAGVGFKNLGLVVIDEQHKFGVYQRLDMLSKGNNPDVLIMTATPIPRTLAMALYSDLDISTIDELPGGRQPVKTYVVGEGKRGWVYDFLRENLKKGRQAYIVYPIIDESEKLDLKAASTMYEDLKDNIFKEFKVGLIHGRLKQKQRNEAMQSFKDGQIDILVSTVVIEVGLDIPNASVMVIEHAERFGLAQLHQLRGRVGRGAFESFCILLASASSQEASLRLEAIAIESDGFKIAEKDLQIRGPGEFFGSRQHGIPELRVNPLGNLELINTVREEARSLLAVDPSLQSRQNAGLFQTLQRRFPEFQKLKRAS